MQKKGANIRSLPGELVQETQNNSQESQYLLKYSADQLKSVLKLMALFLKLIAHGPPQKILSSPSFAPFGVSRFRKYSTDAF